MELDMEDNHHHQEHQQPKFNNNGFPFSNQQHYNQLSGGHHNLPPCIFPQSLPTVPTVAATRAQGFSQFAHNNSFQFFQSVPLQLPPPQQQQQLPSRPQRRQPIHQDQETVSCSSTSPFMTPLTIPGPGFSPDLDGKNGGGFGFGAGGGGGGGDGLLRGIFALDTRREAGGSHYGGWQNQEDSTATNFRQPLRKPLPNDNGGEEIKDKEMELQPSSDKMNKTRYYGELQGLCGNAATSVAASNKAYNNGDDGGLVDHFAAASNATNTTAPCLPPMKTSEDTNGDDQLPSTMATDADEDEEMKQKKMRDAEMSSMTGFFERLVYQLMEHQENLHKKFMAAIEKLDQERKEREQVWRQKEMERLEQEAALRANERALASQREASIVSYLEKITGQSIQFPSNLISSEGTVIGTGMSVPPPVNELSSRGSRGGDDSGGLRLLKNRWPPVEVDALIQVRMSLEKKFQGPGYKGPLWDEISNLMASMGYHRTAKRCKEKWENINKYFKKSKENSNSNPKSRKKLNKTCRYFDQLDQLYSKSSPGFFINGGGSNSCSSSSEQQAKNNGKVLLLKQNEEAIVSPGNLVKEAALTMEEMKQGSIAQRLGEGEQQQHPMNYSMEDMEEEEEEEELEDGHGNGNGHDDDDAA